MNRLNPPRLIGIPVAAALGLMLASSAEVPQTAPDPVPISTEDAAEMTGYFSEAIDFARTKGVTGIEDVKLHLVSGNERTTCHLWSTTTSGDHSNYCSDGDGSVAVTATDIHQFPGASFRKIFIAGHEVGHAKQDHDGELTFGEASTRQEIQATCLAGEFMQARYPEQILAGLAIESLTGQDIFIIGGGDAAHGTVKQQHEAFMHGASTGDC